MTWAARAEEPEGRTSPEALLLLGYALMVNYLSLLLASSNASPPLP